MRSITCWFMISKNCWFKTLYSLLFADIFYGTTLDHAHLICHTHIYPVCNSFRMKISPVCTCHTPRLQSMAKAHPRSSMMGAPGVGGRQSWSKNGGLGAGAMPFKLRENAPLGNIAYRMNLINTRVCDLSSSVVKQTMHLLLFSR